MITKIYLFSLFQFFSINYDGYLVLKINSKCKTCDNYYNKREFFGAYLVKTSSDLSNFIEYYQQDTNRIFINTHGYPNPSVINFNRIFFTSDLFNSEKKRLLNKFMINSSTKSDSLALSEKIKKAGYFPYELLEKNKLTISEKTYYDEKIIVFKVNINLINGDLIGKSIGNGLREFIDNARFDEFNDYILLDVNSAIVKPMFTLIPYN